MTETLDTQKTPGVVILVAILNFIWAFFALLFMLACIAISVFGNVMGLADFAARRLSEIQSTTNFTYGLNFAMILLFMIATTILFTALVVGIGLLKGKKFAWFMQVAFNIMGLIGFPIGTVINGVILFFFFQPRTREYFKV